MCSNYAKIGHFLVIFGKYLTSIGHISKKIFRISEFFFLFYVHVDEYKFRKGISKKYGMLAKLNKKKCVVTLFALLRGGPVISVDALSLIHI